MKPKKQTRKAALLALAGAAIGMPVQMAGAAIIDIDGRLSNSTETSALEWGDNSSRGDTSGSGVSAAPGTNVPDPDFDDDGVVRLTFSANGQGWRTGYATGAGGYDAGEEWNVRSSYSATTAAGAISQGAFYEITLDSTGNASALFSLDSISVSLWRNGTGADDTFQLAFDAADDGFDASDLLGSASTLTDGIGGASAVSYNGLGLPSSTTTAVVRLYHWGNSSINGNIHIYDAVAGYTVIPEPGVASLMAVVGGGFLLRRRRSRSV